MKTTYFCFECFANGVQTDCGDSGGDDLVCPVDENHKLFIPTIDKR